MKRFRKHEDSDERSSKKTNRDGLDGTNDIKTRIKNIECFYDKLEAEKRTAFYEWLPKKEEGKDGEEDQVPSSETLRASESTAGGRNQEPTQSTAGGRSQEPTQSTAGGRKQEPTQSKKTRPSRLIGLENPPRLTVLADPWAWSDYRSVRGFRQTPRRTNGPILSGMTQRRETMGEWRKLESIGDKMLSVIILRTLKRLYVPFPFVNFLHENLSRNDLWRAWALKLLPDYTDGNMAGKADAYEVIPHPALLSLPPFCI